MAAAPHAMFVASFGADAEFEHPPGAVFARALEASLRKHFASVGDFDNWRDCGWVVDVSVSEKQFEVYFAIYGEQQSEWLLAVAPLNEPGLFARLLGRKPVGFTSELQSISAAVHELLQTFSGITKVRWFIGGPPESVPQVASPQELAWQNQP